jgi:3alpha(or 20beta)-hydroxysteroid dehydrogenase
MIGAAPPPLDGRVAIVSGGARGMGAAFCERLVRAGARVVIGDLLDDEGQALAVTLGEAGRFEHLDVTSETSWAEVVSAAQDWGGGVDVLVNNAGILRRTRLSGGSVATYRAVVDVNQLGVYLGMRAVVDPMIGRGGGSIVNISSIDGLVGMPEMAAYVATKWAVRGMTKTAAVELGPLGIRCNSIHPGYIDTPMLHGEGQLPTAVADSMAASVPAGRMGRPADVAEVCLFLASPASAYCSGAEIVVDGGLIAGFDPITD